MPLLRSRPGRRFRPAPLPGERRRRRHPRPGPGGSRSRREASAVSAARPEKVRTLHDGARAFLTVEVSRRAGAGACRAEYCAARLSGGSIMGDDQTGRVSSAGCNTPARRTQSSSCANPGRTMHCAAPFFAEGTAAGLVQRPDDRKSRVSSAGCNTPARRTQSSSCANPGRTMHCAASLSQGAAAVLAPPPLARVLRGAPAQRNHRGCDQGGRTPRMRDTAGCSTGQVLSAEGAAATKAHTSAGPDTMRPVCPAEASSAANVLAIGRAACPAQDPPRFLRQGTPGQPRQRHSPYAQAWAAPGRSRPG